MQFRQVMSTNVAQCNCWTLGLPGTGGADL